MQTGGGKSSVTTNGQLNWVYDRSEQPVSMSGSDTGSFVYDAHRRRVRQDINGETIYSVYTSSGAMVFRHNATTGEATDYLRLGGRTIARLATSGGATTVTYTHSDHLGSPAAATNAAGALLWREDYTPFGEARQAPAANDDGESFTGHIADTDTGLVYMQARYYDPAIGRFLSNDPVGFASGGVGYFNRYAYVGNNPLNATDPTGMVQVVKVQASGQASGPHNQTVRGNAGVYAGRDSRGRTRVGAFVTTGAGGATRRNAGSVSTGFAIAPNQTTDDIAGRTITFQGDIDIPGSRVDGSVDVSVPESAGAEIMSSVADGSFDFSSVDVSNYEVAVEVGIGTANMGSVTYNQTYEAGLTIPHDGQFSGGPDGDVTYSYTSSDTEQQKAFSFRDLFTGGEERPRGN